MAYECVDTTIPGVVASADLSASQYHFVTLTGTGIAVAAVAGGRAIGVLQDKPSALGRQCLVWGEGATTKVVAGGAITPGQTVSSDGSGQAVHDVTTGHHILGYALDSAGASGDIVTVFLVYQGIN